MQIVYWLEPMPETWAKSLFLAGPTPRELGVQSWRPAAMDILKQSGYDGVVFVPEYRDGRLPGTVPGTVMEEYTKLIDWETEALNRADVIVFWVPRELSKMPGFTTNHEHGEWFRSGKVVLGSPRTTPKMRYLRYRASQYNVPQAKTLEDTLKLALDKLGDGAVRNGGECCVPLYIWRTPSFQNWYQAQKQAGNRLDGAKVEWVFMDPRDPANVFFWILHVDIFVASENRHKTNEVVLSRPDISTAFLFKRGLNLLQSVVVLIREFRSSAATPDGFVHELPGGSDEGESRLVAVAELLQETGFNIDASRLVNCGSRQLVATLPGYCADLFAAEITEAELVSLRQRLGITYGVAKDTEQTMIEIRTVQEILDQSMVDWSTLGMILSVLMRH